MEIKIKVPDPRFKPGDFIKVFYRDYFRLQQNIFYFIVRIENILVSGEFYYSKESLALYGISNTYSGTVQEGSSTSKGTLLRPGYLISYLDIELIDTVATLVEYKGTIWEPDTLEDVFERQDIWEKQWD